MRRFASGLGKQSIALAVFMALAAVSLYSQETSQAERALSKRIVPLAGVDGPRDTTSPARPGNESSTPQATPTPSPGYVFPTKRERFNRYVKSTVGPFRLGRTAISAGLDQWRDNPTEWGQGASGYGKRFASGFGRNAIQQTVIYGLDSGLGLDTGFRRSTRKGFLPRAVDALAENITSRTRTGKRVISVPRLSGVYASRIIAAETWYPARYSYKDGLRSGTRSLVTDFGINLLREFVINW